jgi:hypothetical protein
MLPYCFCRKREIQHVLRFLSELNALRELREQKVAGHLGLAFVSALDCTAPLILGAETAPRGLLAADRFLLHRTYNSEFPLYSSRGHTGAVLPHLRRLFQRSVLLEISRKDEWPDWIWADEMTEGVLNCCASTTTTPVTRPAQCREIGHWTFARKQSLTPHSTKREIKRLDDRFHETGSHGTCG